MRLRSVLVLAPFLLFAAGCPPKQPPPPDDVPPPPPPPEITLQVISIDPNVVSAGEPFRAEVFGSGFEEGAQVWVGTTRIAGARVMDGNTIEVNVPPLNEGSYDVKVQNADLRAHVLRSAIVAQASRMGGADADGTSSMGCEDITIQFEFDQARLTDGAMRVLQSKLACFTQRSGSIRVEGHCDERGTTEYNLALGQRRADAVKRWLAAQGVPASRIQAISFGEERPVDARNTEDAWARNRRGQIQAAR
jgi:peptidoglycan-associated lipoprotein